MLLLVAAWADGVWDANASGPFDLRLLRRCCVATTGEDGLLPKAAGALVRTAAAAAALLLFRSCGGIGLHNLHPNVCHVLVVR